MLKSICVYRITSYNVCYTKLLRLGVADSKKLTPKKREQLASQIKKHADGFFVLEISPSQIDELRKIMSMNEIMVVCFAKVLEQLKPRITSYNVCYTKLLRDGCLGAERVEGAHFPARGVIKVAVEKDG